MDNAAPQETEFYKSPRSYHPGSVALQSIHSTELRSELRTDVDRLKGERVGACLPEGKIQTDGGEEANWF
jgi:hypothetical protein